MINSTNACTLRQIQPQFIFYLGLWPFFLLYRLIHTFFFNFCWPSLSLPSTQFTLQPLLGGRTDPLEWRLIYSKDIFTAVLR